MHKHELISILESHRRSALGAEDSELNNERALALDHYYGRPYGDEEDGHSKVVSKDLKETLDWLKPALIKIFVQSGNIAEFIPVGEEDEEAAKQETEVINHVLMAENNGVLLLHDLFHDALLLKNAYCKHYFDEREVISETEYSGLTEDELALLMSQLDDAEIVEQEMEMQTIQTPAGPIELSAYHVCIRTVEKVKKFVVEPIPCEEVRVSNRCRGGTQESPFTEHVTTKTRTELIEMGMDADFVYSLPSINDKDNNSQSQARNTVETEYDSETALDRSMDEIEYCEAYVRVDFDGDKKAELRRVITVGNMIPNGKEWNEVVDRVGITSLIPKRVPHRHTGESLDDDIADLQQINTVLKRQLLDNIYRTNSTEKVINDRVELEDALRTEAGNVIRVSGNDSVDGSLMYARPQPIVADILPVIDMINQDKQNRTGVNETNTNIDPDVLKDVNNKVYLEGVAKASQKVEMIARLLAEGVKEICIRLHELMIKHSDKELIFNIRGQYVPINPQEWKRRTDMRIKVGLGTGTEEEKRMKLMAIAAEQERMMNFGLVGPQQAYNLFSDISRSLGEEVPEKYVMMPGSEEHQMVMQSQQNQPNPLAEAEQIKGQFAIQKTQMEVQMRGELEMFKQQAEAEKQRLKADYEAELQALKTTLDDRARELDRESREAIEILKAEVELLKVGIKQDIGQPGIGGELG